MNRIVTNIVVKNIIKLLYNICIEIKYIKNC